MSPLPAALAAAQPWLLPATILGAFAATAALTGPLTRWLAAHQFGKAIRLDGPQHQSKQGTPTMGGLAMLGVLFLAGLPLLAGPDRPAAALMLVSMLAFGALGLLDDIAGLARRSGRKELGVGLRARTLFALQLLAALLLTVSVLRLDRPQPGLEQALHDLPLAVLMVLAIVGTVNGVNLSDGLDGLATGLLAIAFAGLLAMGLGGATAVLASVALGATLGFLVHNRHPARVFMGNVASMGLGALLAMVALLGGKLLLLPVLGAVFVAEVLSDLIQVGWFKWTRRRTGTGRRVFRIAPIHHHFEALGWPETRVVRRFWQAGAGTALFAWMLSRWLV